MLTHPDVGIFDKSVPFRIIILNPFVKTSRYKLSRLAWKPRPFKMNDMAFEVILKYGSVDGFHQ